MASEVEVPREVRISYTRQEGLKLSHASHAISGSNMGLEAKLESFFTAEINAFLFELGIPSLFIAESRSISWEQEA